MQRSKRFFGIILQISVLVFVFAAAGYSSTDAPRVHTKNSVTILKGNQPAGKFTKEFPLPGGEILRADGPCVVKMQGLALGATDGTIFSIDYENGIDLDVIKGTVYFSISNLKDAFALVAPSHSMTVEQVLLNASTAGGVLNGVVDASEDSFKVGVIDGGSLQVATLSGSRWLKTGQAMEIVPNAQRDDEYSVLFAGLAEMMGTSSQNLASVIGGAATAGLGGFVAYQIGDELADDDDDDERDASPSVPR